MSWLYEETEFIEPLDYWGFVYCIENLVTGKKYFGKKQFYFSKIKKIKGKRKRYLIESDWKDYYGSSEKLLDEIKILGIDNFKRTILKLCMSKSMCSYYEAKYQFDNDVLLNPNDYYNEWILATRGSFTSPQAIKGKEILDRHDISAWRKDNTYLFEIIYPENRIVVDYGDEEKLVVIGGIHTERGEEIPDSSLFWTQDSGFEIVTTYKTWGESYDLHKEEIIKDKEGYVIRFKNGFRMKIKGEEYKRLHKILTNISNRDIWEYLKDNKSFDEILDKVPDEFYDWVKETARDLTSKFENIDDGYNEVFNSIFSPTKSKKDFAIEAKRYPYSSLLFAMYDGKPTHKIIWKLIKPKYSKPFKKEE